MIATHRRILLDLCNHTVQIALKVHLGQWLHLLPGWCLNQLMILLLWLYCFAVLLLLILLRRKRLELLLEFALGPWLKQTAVLLFFFLDVVSILAAALRCTTVIIMWADEQLTTSHFPMIDKKLRVSLLRIHQLLLLLLLFVKDVDNFDSWKCRWRQLRLHRAAIVGHRWFFQWICQRASCSPILCFKFLPSGGRLAQGAGGALQASFEKFLLGGLCVLARKWIVCLFDLHFEFDPLFNADFSRGPGNTASHVTHIVSICLSFFNVLSLLF